jgi:hypothetical protein
MMNHASEMNKWEAWRQGAECHGEGKVDAWIRGIKKGLFPVQAEFLCNHRANKLAKFITKYEKIHRCSIDPTPYIYIKFQDQIHRNEIVVKKKKILIDLISQIC